MHSGTLLEWWTFWMHFHIYKYLKWRKLLTKTQSSPSFSLYCSQISENCLGVLIKFYFKKQICWFYCWRTKPADQIVFGRQHIEIEATVRDQFLFCNIGEFLSCPTSIQFWRNFTVQSDLVHLIKRKMKNQVWSSKRNFLIWI